MEPLLTSEEMRSADLFTIRKIGIPVAVLMEHAAGAVVERLQARFQSLLPQTKGLILAGGGNNGGDAVAVSRLLHQQGVRHFSVLLTRKKTELSPLCKDQVAIAEKLGISFVTSSIDLASCDWIIDGMFGTGLSRPLEGKDRATVEKVNTFSGTKWIVSIDLPSGLSAETGKPLPIAVQASETVALGFYKRGLVTGESGNFVGRLSLATIQIPRESAKAPSIFLYTAEDAKKVNRRSLASHKGNFGHVYIWAGENATEGASVIASLGSLRSGAGLVTVLGSNEIRHRLPAECMVAAFSDALLGSGKGTVFVVGPGMGTGDASWASLKKFLESNQPLVLDADALTLIAEHSTDAVKLLKNREGKGGRTVFTPHPKEAARLLKTDVMAIEKDRYSAIDQLVKLYKGAFLLKGHGTLIKKDKETFVVRQGDSGLAKGGTGDLLSGIIAGVLAQGHEPVTALAFSAYCHGRASELVTQKCGTERATLATELADALKDVFRELEV